MRTITEFKQLVASRNWKAIHDIVKNVEEKDYPHIVDLAFETMNTNAIRIITSYHPGTYGPMGSELDTFYEKSNCTLVDILKRYIQIGNHQAKYDYKIFGMLLEPIPNHIIHGVLSTEEYMFSPQMEWYKPIVKGFLTLEGCGANMLLELWEDVVSIENLRILLDIGVSIDTEEILKLRDYFPKDVTTHLTEEELDEYDYLMGY